MSPPYNNRFCWHDLHTPDKNLSRVFYELVFGWALEDLHVGEPGAYTSLSNGGKAFGGVEPLPSDQAAHWVGYIAVTDFHARVETLTSLGAQAVLEPISVPELGTIAIFRDPYNSFFALLEPARPEDTSWMPSRGKVGDLDWAELSTDDVDGALAFYGSAFGWTFSDDTPEALGDYRFILHDGAPIGGVQARPPTLSQPGWNFYGNVADVQASITRATGFRGTLIWEKDVPGTVHFALLRDPQGARIGIARGV